MQTNLGSVLQQCRNVSCGWPQLVQLINVGLQFFIYLATVGCTISLIYAGFLYLTSGDNASKRSKAHGVLGYAIVGLVIVMLAWLIVNYILKTIGLSDPSYNILK
jgi:heme/copper-type cytochrome/quinol oxidase subunit 4